LSYFIWGGPPDQTLLDAAESGLDAVVEAQVQRMLEDPRAIEQSANFLSQWLGLDRLDNLSPNRARFPDWNEQLAADMKQETLAFFRDVVWEQQRPLSELFNARVTFATPRLARHYGLPPGGEGLTRYDLSSVTARGGLLTHGSVLTVGGDGASMVTRGLFVMKHVLRGVVKDPPPCVDTTPVPSRPGMSQRTVAEARIANPSCGGCHGRFEPLAFALERFDGVGAYHEKDEYGNALRDDGEILFPGSGQAAKYQSSAELMNLLAGSERVKKSISWKLAQFALGRPLGAADAPLLDKLHEAAQKQGGTYAALVVAIAQSELFRVMRTEKRP
jgi:hypothetical protein